MRQRQVLIFGSYIIWCEGYDNRIISAGVKTTRQERVPAGFICIPIKIGLQVPIKRGTHSFIYMSSRRDSYTVPRLLSQPTRPTPMLTSRNAPGAGITSAIPLIL